MPSVRSERTILTDLEILQNFKTMAAMYTRPATLSERVKGAIWRFKFHLLRSMAEGWDWAVDTECDSRIKRMTIEVKYE